MLFFKRRGTQQSGRGLPHPHLNKCHGCGLRRLRHIKQVSSDITARHTTAMSKHISCRCLFRRWKTAPHVTPS